jgi:hypothetical protein
MNITALLKQAEKFAIDNSPSILTAIGVVGTVTTAYLTGKASFKAAQVIREEKVLLRRYNQDVRHFLSFKDQAQMVWKLYIPAASTGVLTVASILAANHVSVRRATAMATAYSLSERAFTEYKGKVVEKIGENKEREVRDEVAQDRVDRNPVGGNTVIITGKGEVLCYDTYTGRYFNCDMDTLLSAKNEINHCILNQGYASLTDFYHEIGLSRTEVSDEVGWNTDQLLELDISTTLAEDKRPCLTISFNHRPIRKFDQFGSC